VYRASKSIWAAREFHRDPTGTLLGVLAPDLGQDLERPGESRGACLAFLLHPIPVTLHVETVLALLPVGSSQA
jgi:hypothetical protein